MPATKRQVAAEVQMKQAGEEATLAAAKRSTTATLAAHWKAGEAQNMPTRSRCSHTSLSIQDA